MTFYSKCFKCNKFLNDQNILGYSYDIYCNFCNIKYYISIVRTIHKPYNNKICWQMIYYHNNENIAYYYPTSQSLLVENLSPQISTITEANKIVEKYKNILILK